MNPPDPIDMMPHWMACQVVKVADGDTVTVQAQLGLGIEHTAAPARLLGIQAPELHGDDAYHAHEARRQLARMVLNQRLYMHVPHNARDRYGRWLAFLWLPRQGDLISINRWMVEEGHAWTWWPAGWGKTHRLPPLIVPYPKLNPH